MRLGEMRCPWHPTMTLDECKPLHEAAHHSDDSPVQYVSLDTSDPNLYPRPQERTDD